MSADNTFTRIVPRQTQEYRLRTKYKITDWFNLNGSITIWEGRNNVFEVNSLTAQPRLCFFHHVSAQRKNRTWN